VVVTVTGVVSASSRSFNRSVTAVVAAAVI